MNAVDNELKAKGLTKVEDNPELLVATLVSTESDLTMTNPSWVPAMGSINTGIPVSSQAWPVTKGTLVVEISNAKTKNGVWRGMATHTLEHGPSGNLAKDAKVVEKPINKAVQKMFKRFPQSAKS